MRMNDSVAVLRDLVERARSRVASHSASRSRSSSARASVVTAAVAADIAELDRIRAECHRLVTRRASWSAGAAVIPLPGLDVGTDLAILLKLLPKINERFGLTPQQIDQLDVESKRRVMVFASGVGSMLIGRLVTRELVVRLLMRMGVRITAAGVVKYVPLLGSALAASLSFGAMKLLGDRHVEDCYEVARRTLLAQARDSTDIVDITPRS